VKSLHNLAEHLLYLGMIMLRKAEQQRFKSIIDVKPQFILALEMTPPQKRLLGVQDEDEKLLYSWGCEKQGIGRGAPFLSRQRQKKE